MMHTIEEVAAPSVDVVSTPSRRQDHLSRGLAPDLPGRAEARTVTEAHGLALLLQRFGRAATSGRGSASSASVAPHRDQPMPFC